MILQNDVVVQATDIIYELITGLHTVTPWT